MDLGISSPQIDEADVALVFNLDSNLDMRMNQKSKINSFRNYQWIMSMMN